MITNHSLGTSGRLGNQLFQYAALKSLSLANNYELILPDIKNKSWHGQKCLLDQFNLDYDFTKTLPNISAKSYKEPSTKIFDSEFFKLPDNTHILGHFQNLKYFEQYKDIICNELTPIDSYQHQAKNILKQFEGYETVSVHIRRGDNITENNQDIFGKNPFKLDPDSFWAKYFNQAQAIFADKKVKYLIFTGGSRNNDDTNDYKWVKDNLGPDYVLLSTPNPVLDYAIISNCDHNILSPITSFGWWASYVNKNPNKIQVAPKNYFLDNSDASRLFDKNYTLI